ncbi:MAG TPA: DNA translocase FtsK [Bryobacteraceae bacterium]|jgi:DNA segregation ATPase FtsK/SpoIIIE, S-DNA-T family|nr:DNA translocase FtsK [Bryobacteraceae bacterium]
MNYLGPTARPRLNEAVAVVFLFAGLFLLISLVSYNPFDSSWNTAAPPAKPLNLMGRTGATLADFLLQAFGFAAYAIPVLTLLLGWSWVRSVPIHTPWAKLAGSVMLVGASCAAFGFGASWRPIADSLPAGGVVGGILADSLVGSMNLTGAAMFTGVCWILGLYLVSTFEMSKLAKWFGGPASWIGRRSSGMFGGMGERWQKWREARARTAKEQAEKRALQRTMAARAAAAQPQPAESAYAPLHPPIQPAINDPLRPPFVPQVLDRDDAPAPEQEEIPIRTLEELPPEPPPFELTRPEPVDISRTAPKPVHAEPRRPRSSFKLPPTSLLQEPPERTAFDSLELKETAAQIKSKFEEFNVRGSVTQINPGPVVTTFEFKPEAGVKYSRITTLTEDLCLGLQAESILIERIPGKPTVGIEVPNSKREVISLRQILESEEFHNSSSPLTVALGKDINGRMKIAALDSMPHLLIAGSTGSGKSVMLNSLIMSILYKATPQQVRMIMVDPKRLEFGLYEGIPHLLTPVITDPKKATNALRNAVLEMERRLKLLASLGVRNIDQYNRKVRQLQAQPRSLFEEESEEPVLEPIPYILILIDELADLMMLERANVEETVTRLAQMARAVGMHLVLATQRPSVDVITGLIKANFPSRISFRVATRVDSRTVLDVMGAEHLLGRGDMLFLPPGSSRLVRVHGSYVSEAETNDVVEFWKRQAAPEYDQTFLLAPPAEDEELDAEDFDGTQDPLYQDAVRVVLEQGKASTSTLQRRLRLGYGRAARILDMMQREGIIGPPDGSRPREVLKRPDWLEEVESQLR